MIFVLCMMQLWNYKFVVSKECRRSNFYYVSIILLSIFKKMRNQRWSLLKWYSSLRRYCGQTNNCSEVWKVQAHCIIVVNITGYTNICYEFRIHKTVELWTVYRISFCQKCEFVCEISRSSLILVSLWKQ